MKDGKIVDVALNPPQGYFGQPYYALLRIPTILLRLSRIQLTEQVLNVLRMRRDGPDPGLTPNALLLLELITKILGAHVAQFTLHRFSTHVKFYYDAEEDRVWMKYRPWSALISLEDIHLSLQDLDVLIAPSKCCDDEEDLEAQSNQGDALEKENMKGQDAPTEADDVEKDGTCKSCKRKS